MSAKKKKTERVDGTEYEFGSQRHRAAIGRKIKANEARLRGSEIGDRFDANQTAFLARDLTYVSQDVQRVLYEKLRAAEFCPIKSEVPRGARTWTYKQRDMVGKARRGAHLSADDAPNVDVAYEEFPQPVTHVTASYQYTIEDLEAAAFSGVPLDRDKADACAEAMARELDELMRSGDDAQGITGLFNNPNVPIVTLTNGEWTGAATAAEIIADYAQIEQAGIAQSRDLHHFRRLVLPTAAEARLAVLDKSTGSDLALIEYLKKNGRTIKEIDRWIALDDATGVTVADPPLGLALDTMERDAFYAEVPVPYEELAPQVRGYGWIVNTRAVFGGVVFKRPLAAAYIENLD